MGGRFLEADQADLVACRRIVNAQEEGEGEEEGRDEGGSVDDGFWETAFDENKSPIGGGSFGV